MKKILIAIIAITPMKSFALSCDAYRVSCIPEFSSVSIEIVRNSQCENWNDLPKYESDLNRKDIYSLAYKASDRTHSCEIGQHKVKIDTSIEDTRTGSYECSGVPASVALSLWLDDKLVVDDLPFDLFCRRDYNVKDVTLDLSEGGIRVEGRGSEVKKSYFYLKDDIPVTLEKVIGKPIPWSLRQK